MFQIASSIYPRPKLPPGKAPILDAQFDGQLRSHRVGGAAMLLAREGERSAEAGRIARSERVLRGRGARPAGPPISLGTDRSALAMPPLGSVCPLRPGWGRSRWPVKSAWIVSMAVEPPAPRLTVTPGGRHYHSALGNRMGESAVSWAVPFRRTTADEQEDS